MSFFLFIIVMKVLSKMIFATIHHGSLLGFSVEFGLFKMVNISYLLFADETLVFCGANSYHICSLQVLLIFLKAVFGLKVNMAKLVLVPMGNVVELVGILGCKTSFSTFVVSWPSP